MRYLKQQQLNRRFIFDSALSVDGAQTTLSVNVNDHINLNGGHVIYMYVDQTVDMSSVRNSLILPHGTNLQRPNSPVKGMIRYNDDSGEIEVYQGNTWRALRYKETAQVTQQNLGAGDDSTVYFGPLNPAPPAVVGTGVTWGPQNLLVIVENVIQISGTNFTVVQNPTIGAENYVGTTSVITSGGGTTIYFDRSVTVVSATANGTTATLTYTNPQLSPVAAVGSTITVTGIKPLNFTGVYTVTASTNSTVSYALAYTGTSTQGGTVSATGANSAVYPADNIDGAAVTGNINSILANTTVLSHTLDPETDALASITLNKPIMSPLAAGSAITIGEPSRTISDGSYWLYFSSPPPTGKIVTVISGFDL